MEGISKVDEKPKFRLVFILILVGALMLLFFQSSAKNTFFVEQNYRQSILMNHPLVKGESINIRIYSLLPNEQIRIHRCTNNACSQASTARVWSLEETSESNLISYYTQHTSPHYIWLENKEKPQKERAVIIDKGLIEKDRITVTYLSGSKIEISFHSKNLSWIKTLSEIVNKVFINLTEPLYSLISDRQTPSHYPQEILSQVDIRLNKTPKASLSELRQIRTFLKNEQYVKLDSTIKNWYQEYVEDITYEQKITTLLSASVTEDPALEAMLNHFSQELPDSYVPYLLRGIYFSHRGWNARGKKNASKTADQQFTSMDNFFNQAQVDLKKALSIRSDLLHAYLYLINTSSHSPKSLAKNFYDHGLKIRPESFTLRWWYQGTLLPRWGGSYIELDAIAEDAKEHIEKNPLLPILFGRKYADMANIQRRKGDYQQAISYANTAKKYGQHALFLRELADTYYKLGDRPQARVNYEATSLHLPFNRRVLERRSYLYYNNWDYQQCIDTIDVVLVLSKASNFNYFYKGLCYKELQKHQEATNSFYMAELLDIEDELEDSASNYIKYYEQQGYTVSLKDNITSKK